MSRFIKYSYLKSEEEQSKDVDAVISSLHNYCWEITAVDVCYSYYLSINALGPKRAAVQSLQ